MRHQRHALAIWRPHPSDSLWASVWVEGISLRRPQPVVNVLDRYHALLDHSSRITVIAEGRFAFGMRSSDWQARVVHTV